MSYNISGAFEHALAAIVADGLADIGINADHVHCGFVEDDKALPAIVCAVTGDNKSQYVATYSELTGEVEVASGVKEKGTFTTGNDWHSAIVQSIEDVLSDPLIKTRLKDASAQNFHVYCFQRGASSRVVAGIQRFQTSIPFTAMVLHTPKAVVTDDLGNPITDNEGNTIIG